MTFLRNLFINLFAPRLQGQYFVYHKDQLLAELNNPVMCDQFWFTFQLIPLVTDPKLLEILYNDNSWSGDLIIKEASTKRPVQFLLQINAEEVGDEVVFKSVLESRPKEIDLRGPYKVTNE